jgi:hypothetical protein
MAGIVRQPFDRPEFGFGFNSDRPDKSLALPADGGHDLRFLFAGVASFL